MGPLSRQKAQQKQFSAKSDREKAYNSNALITPPHIRSALHERCMVSTERFSNPLEFDSTYILVIAQVTATMVKDLAKSLGRVLMLFLYATMATPSAILPMMTKSCSDSCATQYTPPSKPTIQLPHSCS
eukprot:1157984-Pelagomonas_calceolata.AAC.1